MRWFKMTACALACLVAPSLAPAQELIPERRAVVTQDQDLPGGDIASIFDTTIEACERAALTNPRATAYVYNTRNGSCFVKADPGPGEFFQGAISAQVVEGDAGVAAAAANRRGEIAFIPDWDVQAAFDQAQGLGRQHWTGPWTAEEHLAAAAEAEARGDWAGAAAFTGAALNLSDDAATWGEFARRQLEAGKADGNQQWYFFGQALSSSINAYLRAENPALRHTILVVMGEVLERNGRGRETVQALRLAQGLQERTDTAALLQDAIGKYGFRITETQVLSDLESPRICATFSEDLAEAGVDYATFVQLTEPGMVVEPGGWRQLCVGGLEHGKRYSVTFREGLPAADGQTMAASVEITQYVRDRNPGVRFPGRGYVLPNTADVALPVETVNTDKLDLTLYRVTDRNLLRSIQDYYFGAPMNVYSEEYFAETVGEALWSGSATVGQEVNRDVTTRLPMGAALEGRPAGIYALKAEVPGVDPYNIPPAWQWFVVSDLGVTTLSGVDGLHVFVRSLATAGAKAGVTVELLNRSNAVLGTATTDDMGYAVFDAGLTRGTGGSAPAMVVVREGEADISFLSLTDPEFDLSDRGVEGREAAPPVDVFVTTERGAYRAGETVYFTALARDAEQKAVEGLPLTAVILRPDGVEYARSVVNDWGGGYVFSQPIAGSAPRGVWRLEMYADLEAPALASKTFLVEDFLPERIDFDLTLADTPLSVGAEAVVDLTVAARYLFGAPGAGLRIEGEVLLRATEGLAAYPGFVFGRHNQPFSAQMSALDGGETDETGTAILPVYLPQVEDPHRPLEARVTVRVAEGSGRPVERSVVKALAPSAPMIGVKPLFDGVAQEGSEARFQLIAVDATEALVAVPVKWTVVRVSYDYQWYQSYGNWSWEPVVTRVPVAEGEVTLGSAPVEIAARVDWGTYEILVQRSDGGRAATSMEFYAGWYAPADASATPDTLELSLDKEA
jgi:uncharacterized protein YfaS (alpha-2-macroglobulin family)